MPTITALAWETLLEPNTRNSTSSSSSSSSKKPFPLPPPPPSSSNQGEHHHASAAARRPSSHLYYISPSLYATPDPASIPNSSPTSPSPYVLNHKRRDARPPVAASEAACSHPNGLQIRVKTDENGPDGNCLAGATLVEESLAGGEENGLDAEWNGDVLVDEGFLDRGEGAGGKEDDDFFDLRESMSVASSSDTEDGGTLYRAGSRNRTPLLNQSEFYDAAEDFISDGSVSHSSSSISTNKEIGLHALRQNLLEEMEKRKRAEEALLNVQNQWQRMAKCLCQVGLSFPEIHHSGNAQIQTDPVALCQEIVVARFVSDAVERGLARAETEAVAEEVIESKNHEISRLRDRLQYYEAMNREMSQRNQEVVELARQQRLRRKTRRRWIWSCIGLSITVGASLLAYSYLPYSGEDPLPISCPDASLVTVESGESDACLLE